MRYGDQRVQTAVITEMSRLKAQKDVLALMDQFHQSYGARFGEGSQSPEAGVRINTIRVCSYVAQPQVQFATPNPNGKSPPAPAPLGRRECHIVRIDKAVDTPINGENAQEEGTRNREPA